jgi:hypothetical protein
MKMGWAGRSTPFDFKIVQASAMKSFASGANPSGSNPNETNIIDASGYWNCKDAGSLEHRTLLRAGGIAAELSPVVGGAGDGLLLVGGMYWSDVVIFLVALETSVGIVCTGSLRLARLRSGGTGALPFGVVPAGSSLALARFGWFIACAGGL